MMPCLNDLYNLRFQALDAYVAAIYSGASTGRGFNTRYLRVGWHYEHNQLETWAHSALEHWWPQGAAAETFAWVITFDLLTLEQVVTSGNPSKSWQEALAKLVNRWDPVGEGR
jgi:hypothetical protein